MSQLVLGGKCQEANAELEAREDASRSGWLHRWLGASCYAKPSQAADHWRQGTTSCRRHWKCRSLAGSGSSVAMPEHGVAGAGAVGAAGGAVGGAAAGAVVGAVGAAGAVVGPVQTELLKGLQLPGDNVTCLAPHCSEKQRG